MTDDPLGIGGGESTPAPSAPDPLGIGGGESQSFSTYAPDKFQPDNSQTSSPSYLGRAVLRGLAAPAALPGDLAVMGINKLAGSNIKTPSQGFEEEMSKWGLDQPKTTSQRLISDVVSGVSGGAPTGGMGALMGASSGLSSGVAREAGAPPIGQFAAGMLGGMAPAAIESAIRPPPSIGYNPANSDSSFANAANIVQKQYEDRLTQENKLWTDAKAAIGQTRLKGGAMASLPQKIESEINNTMGKSLSDDDLKGLNGLLEKFNPSSSKAGEELPPSGDIPAQTPPKPATPQDLSQIIALRKSVSKMAESNPDGTTRWAAGLALRQINDHLGQLGMDAIESGDENAMAKFRQAVQFSAKKFKDFGTNLDTGENPIFENIITKNELTNDQIVKAFGTTTRGSAGVSQLINRMLENAGDQREAVRQNIAQGYLERAIQKGEAPPLEGGETIINPNRMRLELSRLISSGTADGGIESGLRNTIFTKNELAALKNLRDNIKDARAWNGAIEAMGTKIPMVGGRIMPNTIAAGRKAAQQISDYKNMGITGSEGVLSMPFIAAVRKSLAGQPQDWSKFYTMATQSLPKQESGQQPPIPTQKPEQHSQIDGNLLDKFAQAETSGGKNMVNPNSNATGIMQFEPKTWNALVKKYGKDYGITTADIKDPAKQYIMGALNTQENANALSKSLGRNPTNGELYMAHVFGPSGAEKLIASAGTDSLAKDLYPAKVVRANRSIFFDKMRPRSAAEVYAILDSKIG